MTTPSPTLAEQLQQHRLFVLRLSERDLAVKLRTTEGYVRHIESGVGVPPVWYIRLQVAVERAGVVK